MLKIIPISAFTDNYIWLLEEPNNQNVAVVDPGQAEPVIHALAAEQKLTDIIITHHHYDHTGGITKLKQKFPDVIVHGPNNPAIQGLTKAYAQGDICKLNGLQAQFQILETPGHTLDHICYFDGNNLFCGDTLFAAGCGRLFEGTAEQMFNSLTKLKQLPPATLVYCAHEYTVSNLKFALSIEPQNIDSQQLLESCQQKRKNDVPTLPSTIGQELATNPFLRTNTKELQTAIQQSAANNVNEIELFAQIRHLKDIF